MRPQEEMERAWKRVEVRRRGRYAEWLEGGRKDGCRELGAGMMEGCLRGRETEKSYWYLVAKGRYT